MDQGLSHQEGPEEAVMEAPQQVDQAQDQPGAEARLGRGQVDQDQDQAGVD